jgi:hypothetical protein
VSDYQFLTIRNDIAYYACIILAGVTASGPFAWIWLAVALFLLFNGQRLKRQLPQRQPTPPE